MQRTRTGFGFLLLLLLALPARAQDWESLGAQFDTLARYDVLSGTALIEAKGKVVLDRAYGFARRPDVPMQTDALFELGSVSKAFTAMAILRLRDQGKLKLTDTLYAYFPLLPYPDVTLWHLLTHTSGIPDYVNFYAGPKAGTTYDTTHIQTNEDVIAAFGKAMPAQKFRTGARFEYSNTNYLLLGSVIAQVSGMPYGEFLQKEIFEPLGMTATQVYHHYQTGKPLEKQALGYIWYDAEEKWIDPKDHPGGHWAWWLDGVEGDIGIKSNTHDLLIWLHALTEPGYFSEATLAEIRFPRVRMDTTAKAGLFYYGYGLEVQALDAYGAFSLQFGHPGGWPGYGTFVAVYPRQEVYFILLRNVNLTAQKVRIPPGYTSPYTLFFRLMDTSYSR